MVDGQAGASVQPGYSAIAARLKQARLSAFLSPGEGATRGDELDALLVRAGEVYSHAVTEATRATYARRWALFAEWCGEREVESLPATAEMVMLYLTDTIAREGAALSTLRGWMAAINRVHVEAGLKPPGQDPAMTMFLRGLSRVVPSRDRPEPISALRIAGLREVCRSIDSTAVDVTVLRDRAILALHRAGVEGAATSRLAWEQVRLTPRTVRVTILPVRRQTLRTVTIRAAEDERLCPGAAMRAGSRYNERAPRRSSTSLLTAIACTSA